VPDLRSSIIRSRTLTTIFPNTCTVISSSKNICAKSKRIVVEQQESSATALTSPLYTKNALMRKTAKKTQVVTSNEFILAANTEDLKIENHNQFKNQVAKTGADHQPL
jgi:hypothetical protein